MDAPRKHGFACSSGAVHGRLHGCDVDLSWLASIEVELPGGVWWIASALQPTQLAAWKWCENAAWKAYRKGIRTGLRKVMRYEPRRVDPTQFEFLKGNEACAREWQDFRP